MLAAPAALGQVPIPVQEQIELFNSLPPAQQQALIRELQRELPPAQRRAIVQMLQSEGGGAANEAPQPDVLQQDGQPDDRELDAEQRRDELDSSFKAEDWLVLELAPRANDDEQQDVADLRRRLEEGNPYQLDGEGRLLLPGVAPIPLGGLRVEEAVVRIRSESALRPFGIEVTRLPLKAFGADALEPFGYRLFERSRSRVAQADDLPVPADYVVGPGDSVTVQLFGNQNSEYFLTVTREGAINFPDIGPIVVSGLTFAAMRELIFERVAEQMIGVRASVTLGELRTIRVFVLGDVERPGSYTVGGLSTMTNALFASGGVRTIGSLRNVALMRNGERVTTLDLYDLLLSGNTSNDARLQPGDTIFVPPVGPRVTVDGEVRRPAIYELRGDTSVAALIGLAGGFNAAANRTTVKLERVVPNRGTTVQDLDLSATGTPGVAARDGDTIRVLRNLDRLERAVRLSGNVYQEGLYEWSPGMRLSDLLPTPDYVRPFSDLNYVMIRRELAPNVEVEILSANISAIWARLPGAQDVPLEPRDTVFVFNLDTGREQIIDPILKEIEGQAASNAPLPIVRVAGQVRAAGRYPLEPDMRIADLVRAGGGLRESAYATDAELTRYEIVGGEYRETELISVNLAAALRGDPGANLPVAPYDLLNIKEVPRWGEASVTLRGEVVFPGTYPIRLGETLSSVLERAGGLTDQAFAEGSVFTRAELKQREREQLETLARRIETDLASLSLADPNSGDAISVGQSLITQLRSAVPTGRLVIRLEEVLDGRASADVLLRNGDELFVPQFSQEVTVLGEVQYATSHLHEPRLTREDYIAKSGGLTRRADSKLIYVVRANGEVVADSRGRRWFRRSGLAEIRPGDTVVVPLDVDRTRPLARWGAVTQVMYNLAIAAAAVNSF